MQQQFPGHISAGCYNQQMDSILRAKLFIELSNYTGLDVTSGFLRNINEHIPSVQIPHLHNLIEGIYKPKGEKYALCIWSQSAVGIGHEIYPDEYELSKDGSWSLDYAAKNGSLDGAVNRSLFSCMKDSVPVMAIVTSRASKSRGGARYRLLGPAIIENFNPTTRKFSLIGCTSSVARHVAIHQSPEQAESVYIRNRLIIPFEVHEPRREYVASRKERSSAFRSIVLDEYKEQCAVCQSKFLLREEGKHPLVEAEAAHIIGVEDNGPDDPRNGLSLCRRHHWAFDHGLFTVTDAMKVRISPVVQRAEVRRFDLEEYEGQFLVGPVHDSCRPAPEAFEQHRRNKFRVV